MLKPPLEYAHLIIKLFKGVIYSEDINDYEQIQQFESQLNTYFEQIGIRLIIDKVNTLAYLSQEMYKKQMEIDDKDYNIPDIVSKIPLTIEQTIACVSILDLLLEIEKRDPSSRPKIVTAKEIKDTFDKIGMDKLLKKKNDSVKRDDKYNALINKMIEFKFLVDKTNDSNNTTYRTNMKANDSNKFYEIKRLIKVRINADKLEEIKRKLDTNHQS